jgi:hypothetical protein
LADLSLILHPFGVLSFSHLFPANGHVIVHLIRLLLSEPHGGWDGTLSQYTYSQFLQQAKFSFVFEHAGKGFA